MLRIVGVQKNENPEHEFVLLQNQGSMRLKLRGHLLMSECAIAEGSLDKFAYVFSDDEYIPAGFFVLLSSHSGIGHWGRTKDGSHIYHAYIGAQNPIWSNCSGALHIMAPHHSYQERSEQLISMR